MSTIDRTRTPRRAAPPLPQHRTPGSVATGTVASTERTSTSSLTVDRRRSTSTGLIFKVILGTAACLALVGVVAEATADPTSVDADPPVVIAD